MALVAFIMWLPLSGCGFASFSRLSFNDPIKPEEVAFIQPGQTTLSQIVAKLGTPDEMTPLGEKDGAVASYHFLDAKYARINYGWPLKFISPVSPEMIMAGGGLGTDVFQIVFDANWVARQYAFAKHVHANRYKLWPF
ncbi:MAG: hypothetical protein ACKOCD_06950 [Nitrospiraceae bacterium]